MRRDHVGNLSAEIAGLEENLARLQESLRRHTKRASDISRAAVAFLGRVTSSMEGVRGTSSVDEIRPGGMEAGEEGQIDPHNVQASSNAAVMGVGGQGQTDAGPRPNLARPISGTSPEMDKEGLLAPGDGQQGTSSVLDTDENPIDARKEA